MVGSRNTIYLLSFNYYGDLNMKIVLATNNQKKAVELQANLNNADKELNIELVPIGAFTNEEPVEDGITFVENALIKARAAAKVSGLPAIAEDSGLCVNLLGGNPGVLSARYSGDHDHEANIDAVLSNLEKAVNQENKLDLTVEESENLRNAHFVSVMVYVENENDPYPIIGMGITNGYILQQRTGDSGFGYDPIFFSTELGKSFGEATIDEKNSVSHRKRAFEHFMIPFLAKFA